LGLKPLERRGVAGRSTTSAGRPSRVAPRRLTPGSRAVPSHRASDFPAGSASTNFRTCTRRRPRARAREAGLPSGRGPAARGLAVGSLQSTTAAASSRDSYAPTPSTAPPGPPTRLWRREARENVSRFGGRPIPLQGASTTRRDRAPAQGLTARSPPAPSPSPVSRLPSPASRLPASRFPPVRVTQRLAESYLPHTVRPRVGHIDVATNGVEERARGARRFSCAPASQIRRDCRRDSS